MICLKNCKSYCEKGKLELVENYEQAINSSDKWVLHHRDEIRILPSGMVARRSKEELIENGHYFHCSPDELIFMRSKEHKALHSKYRVRTNEEREKQSSSMKTKIANGTHKSVFTKGHKVEKETRNKISKSRTGMRFTEEHKKNLSISHKKVK